MLPIECTKRHQSSSLSSVGTASPTEKSAADVKGGAREPIAPVIELTWDDDED
jgi:hypothetical protein